MVERKIRWNRFTDTGDQIRLRHRYFVAILNEPREIKRIKQKFLEQMVPVDDVCDYFDYQIPGSGGLHCMVFSFSSESEKIQNMRAIYDNPSQFRRDRDLYESGENRLMDYIQRLAS